MIHSEQYACFSALWWGHWSTCRYEKADSSIYIYCTVKMILRQERWRQKGQKEHQSCVIVWGQGLYNLQVIDLTLGATYLQGHGSNRKRMAYLFLIFCSNLELSLIDCTSLRKIVIAVHLPYNYSTLCKIEGTEAIHSLGAVIYVQHRITTTNQEHGWGSWPVSMAVYIFLRIMLCSFIQKHCKKGRRKVITSDNKGNLSLPSIKYLNYICVRIWRDYGRKGKYLERLFTK
jgi:hypothetical protein